MVGAGADKVSGGNAGTAVGLAVGLAAGMPVGMTVGLAVGMTTVGGVVSDTGGSAVVLGARKTGGAIVGRLLADGWRVTAVARSAQTLRAVRDRGARTVRADAGDPDELRRVLDGARAEQGGLDLVVNAVAARVPPGQFGGGPIADADLATFRAWGVAVAEQAFVFLHAGADALRPDGGTLIQLTGGSSLRAQPGRGAWAAGAFATRALVHAAANELRADGIHVALVIIDGAIGGTHGVIGGTHGVIGGTHGVIGGAHDAIGARTDGESDLAVELGEIASTVTFLAAPGTLRRVHEVQLSRAGSVWIP
ncbi:hypothetical protein GCM10009835_16640 [Planosporangium flavigriseum]|uniref:SDR family oxidoreductase n=2 Tax=Planosporangium flavigriseum TaxID=373681 RepID=UPI0031CF6087